MGWRQASVFAHKKNLCIIDRPACENDGRVQAKAIIEKQPAEEKESVLGVAPPSKGCTLQAKILIQGFQAFLFLGSMDLS